MKNKFLITLSFIMILIFVFVGVGCSASAPIEASIDEYIKNKKIAVEKNVENRRSDYYELTTITNTQIAEQIKKTEESYENNGETITVRYTNKEERYRIDSVITYEIKDGVVRFNQSLKTTYIIITRTLNENKEIVENKNESVQDEFYSLEYVGEEMRLYKFDNLNPEKSNYMVKTNVDIATRLTGYTGQAYDIIEESASSYGKNNRLYTDGDYIGNEVTDPNNNYINDFESNLEYFKGAMDKNGNIKAESYEYKVIDSGSTTKEVKIFYEIKYGGSFNSRDIANIPEEEPIYL